MSSWDEHMLEQRNKVGRSFFKKSFHTKYTNNNSSFSSYGNAANLTYDKTTGLTMKFQSDRKCKDNMNYTSTIVFKCSDGVSF